MPLINTTYFDGPLIIAGLNTTPVQDAVTAAIAEYEPEFLRKVLGQSLYDAFMAGIGATSGVYFSTQFSTQFNHGTIAERWIWIRDGHTYTHSGLPYSWPGIKDAIAHYVYFNYRGNNATQTTTVGEQKAKGGNASVVMPDRKMIAAWNRMADLSRRLAHMTYYLRTGSDEVYPEFNSNEPDSEVYAYVNQFGI